MCFEGREATLLGLIRLRGSLFADAYVYSVAMLSCGRPRFWTSLAIQKAQQVLWTRQCEAVSLVLCYER
jgi:hypothetical protein